EAVPGAAGHQRRIRRAPTAVVPVPRRAMGLIEEFIARYRREFDYYDQTARLIAQALDSNLQAAGIRSMVTSRAKSPARLEAKVRQRARTKTYATFENISADIVDL